MDAIEQFRELGACDEACEWVGERTLKQAWEECERADWLLWWAERNIWKYGITRDAVELAACDCAEPALKYVPEGEDRPRLAIEATRRDIAERTPESAAARAATCAAACAAARAAAWDAICTAALAAARAAAWDAAGAAAWAATCAAAGDAALREMCQLVRNRIKPVWEE